MDYILSLRDRDTVVLLSVMWPFPLHRFQRPDLSYWYQTKIPIYLLPEYYHLSGDNTSPMGRFGITVYELSTLDVHTNLRLRITSITDGQQECSDTHDNCFTLGS